MFNLTDHTHHLLSKQYEKMLSLVNHAAISLYGTGFNRLFDASERKSSHSMMRSECRMGLRT
jgi:hypothetical protein